MKGQIAIWFAALVYGVTLAIIMVLCGIAWCCSPIIYGYQWSMKVLKRKW